MQYVVCSVRDTASETFSQPFNAVTKADAIRRFSDTIAAGDNMIAKHPKDFILYKLGMWDDVTGEYDLLRSPEQVIRGADFQSAAAKGV